MHHFLIQVSTTSRLFMLAAFMTSTMGANLLHAADTFGVESSNPGDRPAVMSPDVSMRSTDPDSPPAYGPKDAKVLIIVFSDFQCPHCRRASQAVHQIAAEFPGDVRIEVFQHAQPEHRDAEIAAIAAIAAQRQGHFWGMYDKIFVNPRSINLAKLEQYAQELNLDMNQFNSDMNDPAIKERIREEGELAVALGALGTPGFLINAKLYRGWASWNYFRSNVEKELAASNVLAKQGMDPAQIQLQRAMDNSFDSETFELYRGAILASGASFQQQIKLL